MNICIKYLIPHTIVLYQEKRDLSMVKKKVQVIERGPKRLSDLHWMPVQTEYRDRMHDAIEGYEIVLKREIEVEKVETGGLIRLASETERSGELFKKISRGLGWY